MCGTPHNENQTQPWKIVEKVMCKRMMGPRVEKSSCFSSHMIMRHPDVNDDFVCVVRYTCAMTDNHYTFIVSNLTCRI